VTAAGRVRLWRVYLECHPCGSGAFVLDERLGVDGLLSRQARRLVCLAGASWSYDRSAAHLKELCGIALSDTTIRQVCQAEGQQMRRWQQEAPEASQAFRAARGDIELSSDGTCVHTTGGWREMRLTIFAKRHRGAPATPQAWAERDLPAPHARVAFAAIRTSESLGPQWRRRAARLGIRRPGEITVLADGARWIWKQVERCLPGAQGVLDIYHASEHLYQAAQAIYGEQAAVEHWVAARRQSLLRRGSEALMEELAAERRALRSPRKRASLESLIAYFQPHRAHTCYAERLAAGQPIGSGLVEGGCKHIIGRRLKQTGARWRPRRVDRMAALCCILHSDQWETYWNAA